VAQVVVEAELDIGEVARRTGVAPSALRYYERRGLIEPVGRNGLRRTYAPGVIDRLAVVLATQSVGFSLAEIAEMLAGDDPEVRGHLAAKVAEIDARMAAMEVAREHLAHALECRHDQVLECPSFRAGVRSMLPAAGREDDAGAGPEI
jgi:DNA-binding transcriptional MerR regulator